jgi:hypothetical protein
MRGQRNEQYAVKHAETDMDGSSGRYIPYAQWAREAKNVSGDWSTVSIHI